ncbi:MAG: hypothetical protein SGJ05_04175 [bacterium]|nr:hypothetical protein [bacterium]
MSLAYTDPAGFEAMVLLLPMENRALRIARDVSDLCFELAEAKQQPGLHDPSLINFAYDHPEGVAPNRLYMQFALLRAYCDEDGASLTGFDRMKVRHTIRHYVRMFNACQYAITLNIEQWAAVGFPDDWTPPDQTITLASIGPHHQGEKPLVIGSETQQAISDEMDVSIGTVNLIVNAPNFNLQHSPTPSPFEKLKIESDAMDEATPGAYANPQLKVSLAALCVWWKQRDHVYMNSGGFDGLYSWVVEQQILNSQGTTITKASLNTKWNGSSDVGTTPEGKRRIAPWSDHFANLDRRWPPSNETT